MNKRRDSPSRILTFDLLRGLFICIIVIDHLWRWPNAFQFVTGRAEGWVTAAEGFMMISGLLVGYIHAYKKRLLPVFPIATKLITRGLTLYVWMILMTILLVAASWYFNPAAPVGYMPVEKGDWLSLLSNSLRFDYVHTFVHFLYLYSIFLIVSPLAVILLREKQALLVFMLSFIGWCAGVSLTIEWMQWQFLFFGASVVGFYVDTIRAKIASLPRPFTRTAAILLPLATITIIALSSMSLLPHEPGSYMHTTFGRDPITIWTILASITWLTGLFCLFQALEKPIMRYAGWLLMPLGERSLTAYILHTIPLIFCQTFIAVGDNFIVNTLLSVACIIATWGLLRIPNINKFIPR